MFPYRDENATLRTAVVTVALIVVNVLAWLVVQGGGEPVALVSSICDLGLIPGELTAGAPSGSMFNLGVADPDTGRELVCVVGRAREVQNVFTSMFLHGGWAHLLGNMWFLWLFGNNIEDSMTRPRFVVFYLVCGLAAALAQVATDPSSVVPMVGASGAISGVMGAYLVLYPHVRVFTVIFLGFFLTTVALPAWFMLIYWFGLQFISGLMPSEGEGGVAFWAHAGGFVAGVVLIKLFANDDRMTRRRAVRWQPRRVGWS